MVQLNDSSYKDISEDVTRPYARKPGREIEIPSDIHGYRIGRRVGEGGQCVVYEGVRERASSSFPKRAAIKCLFADESQHRDKLEQGFREERDLLFNLEHPHIVEIFAEGRFASPRLEYMVLEMCRGDASRIVATPKDRVTIAANIGADIADALAYVHSRGVLHRDVKPSNILISYDDRAKLCDFGLSSSGNTRGQTPLFTGAIGTPRYMAPEKIRHGNDTQSTDLYALGASIYELLAGKTPFEGMSGDEMLPLVLNEGLPSLPAYVPRKMQDLVFSLTEAEPRNRASLAEVIKVCADYRTDSHAYEFKRAA